MLKIGDKVKIRKDSEYYYHSSDPDDINPYNPADTIGIVIENKNDGTHNYSVEWEEDITNVYREYDLIKVQNIIYPDE